jgi:uncharacterized protein (DUF1684 family)
MDIETWRSDLEREQADRFDFDGLAYYPPDPDLRFELPLVTFGDHEEVTVTTTTEGSRTYLRWGQFRFSIDGDAYTLSAFRSDPEADHLWIPFKDETNGETTYPAGRYIDLDESDKTVGGAWELDFNRAYSPFCAFSEDYECPLVPPENRLDVRIEAGEKAP